MSREAASDRARSGVVPALRSGVFTRKRSQAEILEVHGVPRTTGPRYGQSVQIQAELGQSGQNYLIHNDWPVSAQFRARFQTDWQVRSFHTSEFLFDTIVLIYRV